MPNFALNDTHTERFSATGGDNLAVAIAARNDAIQLCREGAVPAVTSDDIYSGLSVGRDIISLNSYDLKLKDLKKIGLSQLLTKERQKTIGMYCIRQQYLFDKVILKQIFCLIKIV